MKTSSHKRLAAHLLFRICLCALLMSGGAGLWPSGGHLAHAALTTNQAKQAEVLFKQYILLIEFLDRWEQRHPVRLEASATQQDPYRFWALRQAARAASQLLVFEEEASAYQNGDVCLFAGWEGKYHGTSPNGWCKPTNPNEAKCAGKSDSFQCNPKLFLGAGCVSKKEPRLTWNCAKRSLESQQVLDTTALANSSRLYISVRNLEDLKKANLDIAQVRSSITKALSALNAYCEAIPGFSSLKDLSTEIPQKNTNQDLIDCLDTTAAFDKLAVTLNKLENQAPCDQYADDLKRAKADRNTFQARRAAFCAAMEVAARQVFTEQFCKGKGSACTGAVPCVYTAGALQTAFGAGSENTRVGRLANMTGGALPTLEAALGKGTDEKNGPFAKFVFNLKNNNENMKNLLIPAAVKGTSSFSCGLSRDGVFPDTKLDLSCDKTTKFLSDALPAAFHKDDGLAAPTPPELPSTDAKLFPPQCRVQRNCSARGTADLFDNLNKGPACETLKEKVLFPTMKNLKLNSKKPVCAARGKQVEVGDFENLLKDPKDREAVHTEFEKNLGQAVQELRSPPAAASGESTGANVWADNLATKGITDLMPYFNQVRCDDVYHADTSVNFDCDEFEKTLKEPLAADCEKTANETAQAGDASKGPAVKPSPGSPGPNSRTGDRKEGTKSTF